MMKLEYPVLSSHKDNPSDEDKENAIAPHYGHQSRGGFFPVGRNNTWHGGLHVESTRKAIKAIADGRIIAYRIPEKYLLDKDNEGIEYSNGFILIQHNFETPKKIKFRFYSLYMHLMPKSELEKPENANDIPELFANYMVNVRAKKNMTGLKIREYNETDTKKSKEIKFVSKGTKWLLKEDTNTKPPKGHWIYKTHLYDLFTYEGVTYCVYLDWLERYDGQYFMVANKARDRFHGTVAANGNINRLVDLGEDIEVEKHNQIMHKVPNTDEYVFIEDCSVVGRKIKGDVIYDSVENVDVAVNAGDIVGLTGKFETASRTSYETAHIEVFSDDPNLSNFINNTQDNDRFSYEIEKGKTLQIAKPCNFLKSEIAVKIYQNREKYTQIGFEDIEKVITYDNRLSWDDKHGRYKVQDYELTNAEFGGLLPENSKVLKFGGYMKKLPNGTFSPTTKNAEKQARLEARKEGNSFVRYRQVKYDHPRGGQKYWVKANQVSGNNGEWVILKKDIPSVYLKEPSDGIEDVKIADTCRIRKVATVTDSDNNEWWYVKTKQQNARVNVEQGWIKKSDLTEKNPYNWGDYDWKILEDTGDQYFYMFGDMVEKSEPHNFIEQIWEHADTDGDKKLTNRELQSAMKNKKSLNHISKLICKHRNEWNMWKNISAFEKELKDVYKKGIEEEEDSDRKQKLEKGRDERLKVLKDKIEKLSFWHEIESGDVASDKKYGAVNGIARYFPTKDKVYHFHPIAFVEHMKLISAPATPPWLEIALAEAKKAKFVKETLSPTSEMANKYHTYVGKPKATGSTAWCSSFVSWCLNEAGQKNAKSAGSQSVLWNEGKLFKRIEEPVYGCIVLMTNYVKSTGKSNSHGHVTFLYGVDNNRALICLGGNQGDRLKYSRYYTKKVNSTFAQDGVKVEQKFNGYFLPIDYPNSNGKQPEVVDIKKLNNELAGKAVKSDVKNEKTK